MINKFFKLIFAIFVAIYFIFFAILLGILSLFNESLSKDSDDLLEEAEEILLSAFKMYEPPKPTESKPIIKPFERMGKEHVLELKELTFEEQITAELLKEDNNDFIEEIEPIEIVEKSTFKPKYLGKGMFMSAADKRAYMNSQAWFVLKLNRMVKADCKCEVCGCTDRLDLHHETYYNLGNENIEDVKILCRNCHQKIHNILGYDRRTYFSINRLK